MRKRMFIFLAIGIICFLSGIVLAVLHITPEVIPVTMIAIGTATFSMCIFTRGGTLILDEMVKRIDALSGNYAFIASLYFIFALSITNYFHPLQLSISGLLLIMMLFMSLSFILIRFYLMRRGKAE